MRYLLSVFLIILFVILPTRITAQTFELGYGFMSIEAGWGNLPDTQKLDASLHYPFLESRSFHYTPGIRYSYVNSTSTAAVDEFDDPVEGRFHMLFVLPAAFDIALGRFSIINRMGVGWSNTAFPNSNGLQTNFVLEAGGRYQLIDGFSLSLRYSHISNGYRGLTNPGVDNIVFSTEVGF